MYITLHLVSPPNFISNAFCGYFAFWRHGKASMSFSVLSLFSLSVSVWHSDIHENLDFGFVVVGVCLGG